MSQRLFEVEWRVITGGTIASSYLDNARNRRAFTTREKAEEFYKTLFDAAGVLLITGSVEANIHEVTIE